MKVHHLNAATMCPPARLAGVDHLVAHVLLLETERAGLVLVDTGFGTRDVADPSRLGHARHLLRPTFDPAEPAVVQVAALGLDPADVRHVVVTHLDLDHAGGLHDFPAARVHLLHAEHAAATDPPTFADRTRYLSVQWEHGPDWVLHPDAGDGDDWEGFAAVRPIAELGDDVALVPLPGHTRGHAGVAVNDPARGWLLHAGDGYFHRNSVPADGSAPTRAPWGMRTFERVAAIDNDLRASNLARLQDFARRAAGRVHVFSAHDAVEFETLRTSASGNR